MAISTVDTVLLPTVPSDFEMQTLNDGFVAIREIKDFLRTSNIFQSELYQVIHGQALVRDFMVDTISANKVVAGTMAASAVYIGASSLELDGVNSKIIVKDTQGSPQTRVEIGKIGAGTSDYGIKIYDSSGNVKMNASGSSLSLDGAIITDNTVSADAVNAATLSAITADLGTITAGTITGGTIQTAGSGARVNMTTDGINGYKADGTQTVDITNDGTFRFGPSTGNNLYWDNSTLALTGELITTGNLVEGAAAQADTAIITPIADLGSFSGFDTAEGTIVETSYDNIGLTTVGRKVLLFFQIEWRIWNSGGGNPLIDFNWTLRIRQGSSSGTLLGMAYIKNTNVNYNLGASTFFYTSGQCFGLDASPNGTVAAPSSTTYHFTAQLDSAKHTWAAPTATPDLNIGLVSGRVTAVELRR